MSTVTSSVTIRLASIEDLPAVVESLLVFFAETPWAVLEPNPDREYIAQWLISLDHKSQLFIAEDQGQIVGLCAGTVVQFPMIAHLSYLWEWAWWVAPEYRHTGLGRRLWTQLTEWSRTQGATGAVYSRARERAGRTFEETLIWRWWP